MDHIDFYSPEGKYGELSNYYVLNKPIIYNNFEYASSEHLYQALKFLYEGATPQTLAYAESVRTANTPNKAKILASMKTAGGYAWRIALNPTIIKAIQDGVKQNPNWENVKVEIMKHVLLYKFVQNEHCKNILLSTGSASLSEHTERDIFWGDGGEARSGKNILGKLLENVRKTIK